MSFRLDAEDSDDTNMARGLGRPETRGGCWFCGNQFGKPFYVGSAGDGHLERHPIALGHAIVIFRDRHVADFTGLTTAEVAAYWRDVHTVARMIERVFAPCHMNYQLLGNLVPHLHVHLVPRYLDDPAPGRPLPWEPKPLAQPEFDRQLQLLTEVAGTIESPPH
jgi:diadenosine tetraphosphate (Ap4A) HIT family hydrolase